MRRYLSILLLILITAIPSLLFWAAYNEKKSNLDTTNISRAAGTRNMDFRYSANNSAGLPD